MTILGEWIKESIKIKKFKSRTTYYKAINALLYLTEDCSYVSVISSNPNVNILYHPYEQTKVIGIAIYNYKEMFEKLIKKPKYLLTDLFDDVDEQDLISFADCIFLNRKDILPK